MNTLRILASPGSGDLSLAWWPCSPEVVAVIGDPVRADIIEA